MHMVLAVTDRRLLVFRLAFGRLHGLRGEVPLEAAIDEAVSLAKRYSSEEAGRLVNGILGQVAREARR